MQGKRIQEGFFELSAAFTVNSGRGPIVWPVYQIPAVTQIDHLHDNTKGRVSRGDVSSPYITAHRFDSEAHSRFHSTDSPVLGIVWDISGRGVEQVVDTVGSVVPHHGAPCVTSYWLSVM